MRTSQEITDLINYQSNEIMSAIFNDLLQDNSQPDIDLQGLMDRYRRNVAILKKTLPVGSPDYKANNQLINDHRGFIVRQGITYFLGKKIKTEINVADEKFKQTMTKILLDFERLNDIPDLDLTTELYCSVCGEAARLLYIDGAGKERAMNIVPWEVCFIFDKTTDELKYAMIYYDVTVINVQTGAKVKVKYIEWYDESNVYYYRENAANLGHFMQDPEQPSQKHGFVGVPLIQFLNNEADDGDFEPVESLIDAYDQTISNAQDELDDYRNAYMVFHGINIDEDTVRRAKATGAFGSDQEFTVEFLTKQLNDQYQQNHKETLAQNIFKFSNRVDFSSPTILSGTVSGIALARLLQSLENDASMKEAKFTKGIRRMYQLLQTSWTRKKIPFDYLTLEFQFTRNLPIDLTYLGQAVTAFFGKIPLEKLYKLLPFIDDVPAAIKQFEEESTAGINLNNFPGLDQLTNNQTGQ